MTVLRLCRKSSVTLPERRKSGFAPVTAALPRGILLDPIRFVPQIANCDRGDQLAAPGFLFERFMGTLTQDGQLHLAQGAFHAEQEPVVGKTGIVDPVLIGD